MRVSRVLVVLLLLPLLGFALLAVAMTAWGGPRADDPSVVAERARLADRLGAHAAAFETTVGGPVLSSTQRDECVRGSRAVGGLGVDTGYDLRCTAQTVVHVQDGPLPGWQDRALALHEQLLADGWTATSGGLPALVAEATGPSAPVGFDGVPGPADATPAAYRHADGTEMSLVLTQPGEHPPGQVEDDAMGWATADRLPPGTVGVVLRAAAAFER